MTDLICCGAINWDINLFMRRLPRTGEEVSVREIQRVSGGTAANVAVAASRILGKNRVAFIGALGDDEIAKEQRKILVEEGVDDSGIIIIPNVESGQAYITIGVDGENEIHTYFGANLKLTDEYLINPNIISLIECAKVAVIMDPPLKTAKKLAQLCKEYGITVLWDPGVYNELGLDALEPVLMNVDYFILNHLEFENLLNTDDPKQIAEILNQRVRGVKAIIKHGVEGSTIAKNGVGTTIHLDAVPLKELGFEVINTVGCGDAFVGGFASAKVEGMDDLEALRYGNAAGSFKATRKETRGGPTKEEMLDLVRRWQSL